MVPTSVIAPEEFVTNTFPLDAVAERFAASMAIGEELASLPTLPVPDR